MSDLFDSMDVHGGAEPSFDPFGVDNEHEIASPAQPKAAEDEVTTEEEPEDNQNPDEVDFGAQNEPITLDGPIAMPGPSSIGGSSPSGPAVMAAMPEVDEKEEPQETALSLWEAEHELVLKERREKAAVEKRLQQEESRKEIDQFKQNRLNNVEKAKARNRDEEKTNLADLESVMQYGTLWEKVARLVDLAPKSGAKAQDLNRMRTLLIQLKNEKPQ